MNSAFKTFRKWPADAGLRTVPRRPADKLMDKNLFTGEDVSGQIHYNYFRLLSLMSEELDLPSAGTPTSPNDIVPPGYYLPTETNFQNAAAESLMIHDLGVLFYTTDESKDSDTVVTVKIQDDRGTEFASASGSGKYKEKSEQRLALVLRKPIAVSDLPLKVSVKIAPHGHDQWKFNYHVYGLLTDGQHFVTETNNCLLSQLKPATTDVFQIKR
jgi:hypothetical protein